MSATLTPPPVASPRPVTPPRAHDRFFLGAALLLLAAMFIGFAPTFYLRETFNGAPLPWWLVVHGIGQTAWFVAFAAQAGLVAGRRLAWHRWLGWATVAIAVLTIASTPIVILRSIPRGLAVGHSAVELAFVALVSALRLPFFVGMLWLAVSGRRQRDVHRRWSATEPVPHGHRSPAGVGELHLDPRRGAPGGGPVARSLR